MPTKQSVTGSELFIVDNSDDDWKVVRYLHDWCQLAKGIDIATGYFEIGALLALKDEWQRVDEIRILMGEEVSLRTKAAFERGLAGMTQTLDASLEQEKEKNDFLEGVPAIVQGIRSGKIKCRVYRKDKFHAKAYITHARLDVVGSAALVGSSNLTFPGLTQNIELNVQITGRPVTVLQEWYEEHWGKAEDVTADVLRVIERHVAEYTPFDIYAKALHELFLDVTPGEQKWDRERSQMFQKLDGYQQDGYRNLIKIANQYGGAFLCDGVGLGKTFVGLMLIERLVVREQKNVVLLAPKGAVESVWKPNLKRYLRKLGAGAFSNLFVAAHTDLGQPRKRDAFEAAKEQAHALVIDEAHHFRNPGPAGTGAKFIESPRSKVEPTLFPQGRRSRYRELADVIANNDGSAKQIFMLTATPINNSFKDLRHMIELFTRNKEDHFGQTLGIHSLTAHFKRMEKQLDDDGREEAPLLVNNEEAQEIMARDPLVSSLIVQRSRAFVKEKQQREGGRQVSFPPRRPPQVVQYSLKKVYGKLLDELETAFLNAEPLFTLPLYYPLFYYKGSEKDIEPGEADRQKAVVALVRTSFLKRFESSVEAFRHSCERLLVKLLAWCEANVETDEEQQRLHDWRETNIKLIESIRKNQPTLFRDVDADEDDEDVVESEFADSYDRLPREDYKVEEMLEATLGAEGDLAQLLKFFGELDRFDHRNDDKLKSLVKLLKSDEALSTGKVLIFTEYADTADYLVRRLKASDIEGVAQVDSRTNQRGRLRIIERFSPYYNGSSSEQLTKRGDEEIRILISTDVLSEGLNLQDAARLINYDLHWNPVRLMQRIGRVDRRRNPDIEEQLAADHPDQIETRKAITYYNFLPPDELNELLTLYSRVTRKTLRISKALGIEGGKLLTGEDEYRDLQHFNEAYEGKKSAMEVLELERDALFENDPDLREWLEGLPLRVFSGRKHPSPDAQAVFFCYRMPVQRDGDWTTDGGPCQWLLVPLPDGHIVTDPPAIAEVIRSIQLTPRVTKLPHPTLKDVRARVDKHLKNTYLRSRVAPVGVRPVLLCWMELN